MQLLSLDWVKAGAQTEQQKPSEPAATLCSNRKS